MSRWLIFFVIAFFLVVALMAFGYSSYEWAYERYYNPADQYIVPVIWVTLVPFIILVLCVMWGWLIRGVCANFYSDQICLYPDFFCELIVPKSYISNIYTDEKNIKGVVGVRVIFQFKDFERILRDSNTIKRLYFKMLLACSGGEFWFHSRAYTHSREEIEAFAQVYLSKS